MPVEDQGIYVPIEERGQTDLEDLKDVEQKVKEVVGCGGGGISGGISDGTLTVFEETFGLRNEVKIIYYSNEGTRTFAFPLLKDGKIVNLLLVAEGDNYYILEKTDRLAYEDVIDTKVSPYIARVFDADNYLSRDIQLSNVRSSLGADYETSKEGDILILKEKTADSGRLSRTSTDKLGAYCSASTLAQMTPQYLTLLGLDVGYSQIVSDALVAIFLEEGCLCPSPALVLEHVIPNVSDPNIRQQLEIMYITYSINLPTNKQTYLNNNSLLSTEVYYFLLYEDDRSHSEESLSIEMMIDVHMNSLMYGPYDQTYLDIINQYGDNAVNPYFHVLLTIEIVSLRLDHPDWSDARIYVQASYNVFKGGLHLTLDLAGLIPGIGEIADITNGVIYTIEGDGLNATLSFASAIPVAGWFSTGTRLGKVAVETASGTKATLKFIVDPITDIISFGSRSQLKTIIKPASGNQAHHIIPWQWRENPVVQQAAKSGTNPFHMNDHLNGIPLGTARHNGSHPNYNAYVNNELQTILQNYGGNINPTDALNEITALTTNIRNVINANPNIHINDLF